MCLQHSTLTGPPPTTAMLTPTQGTLRPGAGPGLLVPESVSAWHGSTLGRTGGKRKWGWGGVRHGSSWGLWLPQAQGVVAGSHDTHMCTHVPVGACML